MILFKILSWERVNAQFTLDATIRLKSERDKDETFEAHSGL